MGIIALTIENELEIVIKEGRNKRLCDMKITFMLFINNPNRYVYITSQISLIMSLGIICNYN